MKKTAISFSAPTSKGLG